VLSSEFAVPGEPATPAVALTRREARALETPREVAAQTSRRATRPIGRNGKRLTDRQIARQVRSTVRKGRSTSARPQQGRNRSKPSLGQRFLSLGALLFAGVLLVGMSVPANAFMTQSAAPETEKLVTAIPGQALEVGKDVTTIAATRDAFSVLSWAQVLTLQHGDQSYEYTVGTGTVRWPFPFASPISDGFGERAAPCDGCSSFHNGVDFTPGGGSPIYAIADGVVSYAEVSDYGYGNHLRIVSTINGEQVETLYAHMQMNSSPLKLGDVVQVGDFLGLVGSTGTSTGSHLHLEIKLNGVNVDPFAYLQATVN
jgi:murein DD-endopeptidase MepM/ murein hydrolase activator NlpD